MKKLSCIALILAAGASPAAAQLPAADIWLADLRIRGAAVEVGTGKNATRRPGYDNQPAFLPGGDFLFASGDTTGTDVWRCAPGGALVQVTRTPEAEYSPTPDAGGGSFCAVRVEMDGTQRLWRFDLDGDNPRLVAARVDSLGYFEWIDSGALAAFIVGEPHTLRRIDVRTQRETVVARDIGRFIRRIPGTRDIAFTMRGDDDAHRFFRLPPAGPPVALIDGVGGQDAVWSGDVLLASAGTVIYAARPAESGVWRVAADARAWGAGAVTRLAVSADGRRLAAVCAE